MLNKLKTITSYALVLSIVIANFSFIPTVQAAGPTLTIGSEAASIGDIISVPVTAGDFANAVAGMDFDVQYNPDLLTYTGLTQNAISGHGTLITGTTTNSILINWFDSVALSVDSGAILTLGFTVVSEATTDADLTFIGTKEINDVNGDPIAATFTDGVITLNPAKAITSFSFATPSATGVVDEGEKTIAISVPFGTNVTALVPTIVVSAGASVSPLSGVARDFTSSVIYTVTSADSLTQEYVVTVTVTDNPDIALVAADKAALVDGVIQGANPDLSNITLALNSLPSSGSNGSTITWASSNTDVVSSDGQTVNSPAFAAGNATVIMTATITKGVVTDAKTFTLTVIKLPASAVATVTSETYTVSAGGTGSETITNVPFGAAKSVFLAALAKGESNQTWNDAGIADPVVTGNTLIVTAQDGTTTVTYAVTVGPDPSGTKEVVITEFMANPNAVDDADGEWIEVRNTTASAIDLNGWKINDASTSHTISGSIVVPAEGSAVLCNNSNPTANGGVACDYAWSTVTLNNGTETITLLDDSDTIIYSISYGSGDIAVGKSTNVATGPVFTLEVTSQYGDGDFGTPAGNLVSISSRSYPSIQSAIDAADSGNTITVAAGTFTEDLSIGTGVAVQGAGSTATSLVGNHTLTASNVSLSGIGFSITGAGVALTLDSSGSALDSVSITNSAFDLSASEAGTVGVHVGGGTPTNAVTNVTMSLNSFSGPSNLNCNPWKIGGSFNNPISASVSGLTFSNNAVDKCSIPINLDDSDLTDIVLSGNAFTNTDGAVYVWAQDGTDPTGVLSGFSFINNTVDSTNSYGAAFFGWHTTDFIVNTTLNDDNFGEGNIIANNLFGGVSGLTAGETLNAVSVHATLDSYELNAANNWWNSVNGPTHVANTYNTSSQGDVVSDNVVFVPWLGSGTDTDEDTAGFQPDASSIVTPVVIGETVYSSIQAAIDAASAGNTITVSSGTFTEDLSIGTGVTIQGVGPTATSLIGKHTVTASDVSLSGIGFSMGGFGTTLTLDSSGSALDSISITKSTFDLSTSPSVGVYVGGGTPTNAVTDVTMNLNVFNGPDSKVCNPWKVGGSFGSPISASVTGLTFSNNAVDKCSIPINLDNGNLTDIVLTGNVFTNTDGVVYVWGEGTPSGVLSGFAFTRNIVDSTNSYGVGIDLDGATVFGDANFGTGNKVQENIFSGVPGAYGFEAVSLLSTLSSYELDATKNYWGDLSGPYHATLNPDGTGDAVSDNVSFDPWFNSAARSALSDGVAQSPVLTSTTSGQAELPSGETALVLTNDTVLDLLSGLSSAIGSSITVGGATLDLGSFTSGELDGVDLSSAQTIGGSSVIVAQAVKLKSGTNGTAITLTNSNISNASVEIPDDTTVMAPSGWTGTMQPPKAGSSSGTAPSGFTVGGTVVEVGDSSATLLFDKPVKVTLTGVTGTVAYKPAGSSSWTTISTTCDSTTDSDNISFPGECSVQSGDDTIIWTYHFTSFGNITAIPAPTPAPSGGGGGGTSHVPIQFQTYDPLTGELTLGEPVTEAPLAEAPVVGAPTPQVLGVKEYADGTLIRGSDHRIYAVKNQLLKHIASLSELRASYAGKPIVDVADSVIAGYAKVAGTKAYGVGQLIRGSDKKVYVIEQAGKRHIKSLAELARDHFRKPIYTIADSMVAQY